MTRDEWPALKPSEYTQPKQVKSVLESGSIRSMQVFASRQHDRQRDERLMRDSDGAGSFLATIKYRSMSVRSVWTCVCVCVCLTNQTDQSIVTVFLAIRARTIKCIGAMRSAIVDLLAIGVRQLRMAWIVLTSVFPNGD